MLTRKYKKSEPLSHRIDRSFIQEFSKSEYYLKDNSHAAQGPLLRIQKNLKVYVKFKELILTLCISISDQLVTFPIHLRLDYRNFLQPEIFWYVPHQHTL